MCEALSILLSINGENVEAMSGRFFTRASPLTGEVVTRAAAAGVEDANKAALAAGEAFEIYSKLGPNARRALLNKAAAALEAKADQFVEAMMNETGSTE